MAWTRIWICDELTQVIRNSPHLFSLSHHPDECLPGHLSKREKRNIGFFPILSHVGFIRITKNARWGPDKGE